MPTIRTILDQILLAAIAVALIALTFVIPFAHAQTIAPIPTVAQCDTQQSAAIAFYRRWFAQRMTEAGRPWLKDNAGPDLSIYADPGVQVMACLMSMGSPTTPPSPTNGLTYQQGYDGGFDAGVRAAAANAAATKRTPSGL